MTVMLKKLLVSFLTGLIIFLSIAPASTALAAGSSGETWYNQSFQSWYGKVYDPSNPSEIFGERYTAAQVQWIIYGLFGFLINSVTGPKNTGLVQCFLSNITNVSSCFNQLDKLVFSTSVQGNLASNPPTQANQNILGLVFSTDRSISGIGYVKEKIDDFRLIPVAHAQSAGIGFAVLEPIQSFWRAFRNVAYGLFVIVAIVFAFLIMFRVKLSPQTVVSVQSALPKIIISLILVTFSYAIAGFLIDLMYVVIGIISIAGGQMNILGLNSTNWFNIMTVGQPWGINIQFGILVGGALYIVLFAISLLVLAVINLGSIAMALTVTAVVAPIVLTGGTILPFIVIIFAILYVIVIIILIWMFVRTIWNLLKAFVNIILLTIFAPIQLTLGIFIPSLGFGSWVKSFISNLAVFVVTGTLLLFSFVFLVGGLEIGLKTTYAMSSVSVMSFLQVTVKTLLGSSAAGTLLGGGNAAWPPLLGGGVGNGGAVMGLLFAIVSFVIFTMIPKANDLVQSFLSGKPFAYGSAVGEAVGPIAATGELAGTYKEGVAKGRFPSNPTTQKIADYLSWLSLARRRGGH